MPLARSPLTSVEVLSKPNTKGANAVMSDPDFLLDLKNELVEKSRQSRMCMFDPPYAPNWGSIKTFDMVPVNLSRDSSGWVDTLIAESSDGTTSEDLLDRVFS